MVTSELPKMPYYKATRDVLLGRGYSLKVVDLRIWLGRRCAFSDLECPNGGCRKCQFFTGALE